SVALCEKCTTVGLLCCSAWCNCGPSFSGPTCIGTNSEGGEVRDSERLSASTNPAKNKYSPCRSCTGNCSHQLPLCLLGACCSDLSSPDTAERCLLPWSACIVAAYTNPVCMAKISYNVR